MTVLASGSTVMRRVRTVEWPSLLLCLSIYSGFAAITVLHHRVPTGLVVVAGTLLVTLQSSLQHEFIHGHPTPWRQVNRALASVPLSLWLPFESYRRSHLVHHQDEQLTDPLDDPESHYWTAAEWRALSVPARWVIGAHSTLAGRLLLGPAVTIGRFLAAELRANDGVFERTAIVENSWFFGPLFLFNNLHAAHHERPLLPWYELPAWYRANRGRIVAENGGLVYDGYGEVARRFLFKPHHVVVHPRFGGDA